MAREPEGIFVKEFFQHPAWEVVWEYLYSLVEDFKTKLATGPHDELLNTRHKLDGVYEAISALRTLHQVKG